MAAALSAVSAKPALAACARLTKSATAATSANSANGGSRPGSGSVRGATAISRSARMWSGSRLVGRIDEWGEIDKANTVAVATACLGGDCQSQVGLPCPASSGEGHEVDFILSEKD